MFVIRIYKILSEGAWTHRPLCSSEPPRQLGGFLLSLLLLSKDARMGPAWGDKPEESIPGEGSLHMRM